LPYWHSFGNINADRYQIAFYCSDAHTEFWLKAILFLIAPDKKITTGMPNPHPSKQEQKLSFYIPPNKQTTNYNKNNSR
jgi:hypothetical protein